MTYVVNESCIKCKYMDCVEVCPVDCFYEGENMLVIHPDECIYCGVCEPECPVEAIKPDTEPGLEKKNAVWTGPGQVTGGKGGISAFAASMSTSAGSIASTAETSPRLACSPVVGPKNSLASSADMPSQ